MNRLILILFVFQILITGTYMHSAFAQTFHTDAWSKQRLQFDNGIEITLGSHSELLKQSNEKFQILLGQIRAITTQSPIQIQIEDVRVTTKNAEIYLQHTRDQTIIAVFSGTAEVKKIVLHENQAIVLYPNGQMSLPMAIEESKITHWTKDTHDQKTISSQSRYRNFANQWRWNNTPAVDILDPYAARSEFQFLSLGTDLWTRITRDNISNPQKYTLNSTLAASFNTTIIPTKYYLFYLEGLVATRLGHFNTDHEGSIHLQQAFWLARSKTHHTLSIGRQIWNFGDGLMVGSDSWSHLQRSFDGILLTLKPSVAQIRLLAASLDDRVSFKEFKDFISGLVLTMNTVPIQAYAFWTKRADLASNTSIASAKNTRSHYWTVGLKPEWHALPFAYLRGEAAIQRGSVQITQVDNTLNSHILRGQVGFHTRAFGADHKFETDYLQASGDHNTSDKRIHSFLELFPNSHDFLGTAHQFSQIRNIKKIGFSYSLGFQMKNKPLTLTIAQMFFRKATTEDTFPIRDHPSEKNLGNELDVQLSIEATPFSQIKLGAGFFSPGPAFANTQKRILTYLMGQLSL